MSELLTIEETCDRLRVSRSTVYRLIAERQLKVVKVRRSTLVSAAEIERYVKTRERLA
jgi:excisionase family DNA binding protein